MRLIASLSRYLRQDRINRRARRLVELSVDDLTACQVAEYLEHAQETAASLGAAIDGRLCIGLALGVVGRWAQMTGEAVSKARRQLPAHEIQCAAA